MTSLSQTFAAWKFVHIWKSAPDYSECSERERASDLVILYLKNVNRILLNQIKGPQIETKKDEYMHYENSFLLD